MTGQKGILAACCHCDMTQIIGGKWVAYCNYTVCLKPFINCLHISPMQIFDKLIIVLNVLKNLNIQLKLGHNVLTSSACNYIMIVEIQSIHELFIYRCLYTIVTNCTPLL